MRRHARILLFIGALVLVAGLILGFNPVKVPGLERGGDNFLGLKLGLQLQGGIHLEYRADLRDPVTDERITPSRDQMESLKATIERRVNKSGLGEPIILLLGDDRLLVQIPGVRDVKRAKSLIGETARLEIKHRTFDVLQNIAGITDEDILSVTIEPDPAQVEAFRETSAGLEEAETVEVPEVESEASTEAAGEAEPDPGDQSESVAEGEGEVGAEDPGEGEPEPEPEFAPVLVVEFSESGAEAFAVVVDRLEQSLTPASGEEAASPATETEDGRQRVFPNRLTVTLRGLESRTYQVLYERALLVPGGGVLLLEGVRRIEDTNKFQISLVDVAPTVDVARETFGDDLTVGFTEIQGKSDEDIGLTGDDLARAYPGTHQGSGVPIINIEFNDRGTRKFGELTALIAGTSEQVAFILDGEELISPVVTTAITGGTSFIQGRDFTIERVRDISLLLESGRLPLTIGAPILERDVGPSLGAESLRKSVIAGGVGLGLVLLFMVMYYRAPGMVAAVALVIYGALVLAIFKMVPVTLNLPGVGAAVLSIGMAVDANILIFERMKDELRAGRTLLSAINIGFNRAWPAIRDGNVSTLITCAILFWFADQLGAIFVQGFAITLAIGVGVSMFSAIIISRTFLRLLAETRLSGHLGMFMPSGAAELPQQPTVAPAHRS